MALASGWAGLGLALALGLPLALGLGFARGFAAAVAGPAAVPDLAAAPCGRGVAVRVDLAFDVVPAVRPDLAAVVIARAAVPDLVAPGLAGTTFALAAVPAFAVLLGLAVVGLDPAAVFGVAAAETVLTAALSDLAAVVMALGALFIACMAARIALAAGLPGRHAPPAAAQKASRIPQTPAAPRPAGGRAEL